MSTVSRHATNAAAGLGVAGTLMLGGLWLADRGRRWEVPQWRSDLFVSLRAGPGAGAEGGALWVVPVNPRCGRCRAALPPLHALWSGRVRGGSLVALIVDTPERPDGATLRAIPPLPVWWDRDGLWRRRWGHRLYGEIIEFDASGRFVRTVPADALLRRGWPPEGTRHDAPTERKEEGT